MYFFFSKDLIQFLHKPRLRPFNKSEYLNHTKSEKKIENFNLLTFFFISLSELLKFTFFTSFLILY